MTARELQDALEALIDAEGLYAVTDALAEICHGKAEHLTANWQDKSAAKRWTQAAIVMHHAEDRLHKIQLP